MTSLETLRVGPLPPDPQQAPLLGIGQEISRSHPRPERGAVFGQGLDAVEIG
jgi:hypothetical protein